MLRTATFCGVLLAGALMLCVPALVNGVPFFFADSGAYIGGGKLVFSELSYLLTGTTPPAGTDLAPIAQEEPAFVAGPDAPGEPTIKGRSAYYAVFAYLGLAVGRLWPVVILQALALFWLVTLICRMAFPGRWAPSALLAATGLALATPAGVFAGMIMPDIWAGMMILAVGLLATSWTRLAFVERLLLLCIVLFAVLSHLSNLLLLASLVAVLTAFLPFRARIGPARVLSGAPLAWMALCVGVGIGGDLAFSAAVERITGEPPISRPHLTAHLVDDGPGLEYVSTACPEAGFAVCDYAERLPMPWTRFLFGRTPEGGEVFFTAPPAAKRELAAQDKAFALAVLQFRPLDTTAFLVADGLEQLGRFGLEGMLAAPHAVPDSIVEAWQESLAVRAPYLISALTALSYASAMMGLVALVVAVAVARGRQPDRLVVVAAIVVVALLGNAAICGMLASPEGRFQARAVWLLPLIGALLIAGPCLRRRAGTFSSEDFS